MGNRAIDNRLRKLQELESQIKSLEAQAEAIRGEVKQEMEAQGTDEIHTPNFIVRFKEVISNRFDSKTFKADHSALYEAYMKSTSSKRFTIA